jgi:hypothetical protein
MLPAWKSNISKACSKRRNTGTPECRNTGILFSLLKDNLKKYFKSIRIFYLRLRRLNMNKKCQYIYSIIQRGSLVDLIHKDIKRRQTLNNAMSHKTMFGDVSQCKWCYLKFDWVGNDLHYELLLNIFLWDISQVVFCEGIHIFVWIKLISQLYSTRIRWLI